MAIAKAGFRGVSFNLIGDEPTVGRRIVSHVYPLSDKPYTEDMGKQPRSYNIEGVVVGPDYLDRAHDLITACETPGAGLLKHPLLGSLTVICTECKPRYSVKSKGEVTFRLSFKEEGENTYPGANTDYPRLTRARAASALASFKSLFSEAWSLSGPDWMKQELAEAVNLAVNTIDSVMSLSGLNTGSNGDDAGSGGDPTDNSAEEPDQISGGISGQLSPLADGSGQGAITAALTISQYSTRVSSSTSQGAAKAMAEQQQALSGLVQRLAVLYGILAAMNTAYGSRDEAKAARDQLIERMDELSEQASLAGEHEVVEAFRELTSLVVRAFEQLGAGLAGLVNKRVRAGVTPALVLAYQLYGDAGREAEILSRNPAIVHPGFIPGGHDLEVLDA